MSAKSSSGYKVVYFLFAKVMVIGDDCAYALVAIYIVRTSAGTIPAAQLAVDRINNDSSILPNYYLRLETANDSMVGIVGIC